MNQPLETVVVLQQTLDQLKAAEERLHGIPDWMRELHEEHSGRKAEIDALETEVDEAASEKRAAEISALDLQEKLRHYQEQISLVRTQREYGALLQEIDTAKRQIKELEEQALAALERQEQAQARLAEEREEFSALDGRYQEELAKWEAQKPEVARQVEELEARAGELEEKLPRALLTQFHRIFEYHHGTALAPVRTMERGKIGTIYHCGACNYRVRPQAVVEIRNHGNLVLCDSCRRILYVDEAIA